MKIKTAILGYGRSGSSLHADPLAKLTEDFEVRAVCDIDADALAKAKNRHYCNTYTDYHEMLAKEELDLVVVVTRSSQHCDMACDCLAAGVNVLVTKPWATNVNEAQRLIAMQQATGKILMPWLPARWENDLYTIKQFVDRGDIGKIFQIKRFEYTFGVRNDWQTLTKYGGGYMLNWGPHVIDQPLQLLDTKVVSVYSQMKQIACLGDGEDDYYIVMRTSDGTTVTSEFRVCAPGQPKWIVMGTKGTIIQKGNEVEVFKATYPDLINDKVYSNPVKFDIVKEPLAKYSQGSETIYRHIACVMRKEEKYAVALEDALRLSKIIDGAKLSSKTGNSVFI